MVGIYQNLHTHTNFCDGALPPEGMVLAAIEKGCGSIGFSEHSYMPHDQTFSLSPEAAVEYVRQVSELKQKYEGVIEIYLGMEHDFYTPVALEGLDYCLGAAHYVKKDGKSITVDYGLERQKQIVNQYFDGDFFSLAEAYFGTIAKICTVRKIGIIAHFDLMTKNNNYGSLFDESHPRYRDAAIGAMEEILKDCNLFEVNTGTMYRIQKQEQYPSVFLLKELLSRGGEVILSSDSHNAESICYKFDEMRELLKSIGYTHIRRLTKNGFVGQKI